MVEAVILCVGGGFNCDEGVVVVQIVENVKTIGSVVIWVWSSDCIGKDVRVDVEDGDGGGGGL